MPNKPDTVLRTQPTTSATADLSQYATNISSATGGAYEANSSRTAIDMEARALFVRFDAATGESGSILYHGDTTTSSYGYLIRVLSDDLDLLDDTNGLILSVDLPGVDATADTFSAQFCTRANPLTTGASDAYVTECVIYNETDGNVSLVQATHAAATVSASENLSIGGLYIGTGTLASQYSNTIREVRIGARWHSTAEFWEDYGTGETSTGSGATIFEPLIGMPQTMAQDGEFAGPQFLHAGAQSKASRQRLASPIVNYYEPDPWPVGGTESVFDFIRGVRYDYQNSEPGFGSGPGGANDRARDFESTSNQFFNASDNALIANLTNGTADFAISAWIYMESLPGVSNRIYEAITSGGSANTSPALFYVSSAGNLRFGWEAGGTFANHAQSTGTLSATTWYHVGVTCTHSGGNRTAQLYIDGSADGSGTAAQPTSSPSSSSLMGSDGASARGFDGLCTGVKIEDLTNLDSTAHSYLMSAEANLPTGDLIPFDPFAWWKFKQPSDGYEPARNFRDVTIGGNTYKAHANLYWRRPIPPAFDYAKVRVFAEVIFTGAGTHDAIDVAVVSSTRRPGQFVVSGDPYGEYSTTETISAAASGDEYELEFTTALRLARDGSGMSHIYVATRINSGNPTGDTWIKIRAVHVTPYFRTVDANAPLGFGG